MYTLAGSVTSISTIHRTGIDIHAPYPKEGRGGKSVSTSYVYELHCDLEKSYAAIRCYKKMVII